MANLNRWQGIGRLTRDPEVRELQSGGKVASFGFAVNNRKKNVQTGEWEDEPVFLDVEAWNRGPTDGGGRKLADLVERFLLKGHLAYIEGHLRMDSWTDKDTGQKRQKIKVVMDDVQFLQPKDSTVADVQDRGAAPPARPAPRTPARRPAPKPVEQRPAGDFQPPFDDDSLPF